MGIPNLGIKDSLEVEVLFFVPLHTKAEMQKVTLQNKSSKVKNIQLFSFIEWCLWNAQADMENFQRNLSIGEVEVEDTVIYHKTEYRERRNHYAYYSVNHPIVGFDTDRESFFGLYNGFHEPKTVLVGKPSNSIAHGWSPIASHCLEIKLSPGEKKELIFILGYEENDPEKKWESKGIINKSKSKEVIARFSEVKKVDDAFSELSKYWDQLLGNYQVQSGEPKLDRMVNIWNQYQCMITFCFSRSASYFESGIEQGMVSEIQSRSVGICSSNSPIVLVSELLILLPLSLLMVRVIINISPTKKGNNDIGSGFNDDPLWLILGVTAYIKKQVILVFDVEVPFNNRAGQKYHCLIT